ncbi:hypothetical protein ACRYCC_33815 [Actinomadura scrupuli]|uniref:hypothetical protein n=1 Tax=Actinomadura scrupuli TaxID=559629 RepID=UPI003D998947
MPSQHRGAGHSPIPGADDPGLPQPVAPAAGPPAAGGPPEDPAAEDALVREIETHFPGWGVWRSDTRRWWAFRTAAHPLTIEQLRAGCRLIVQADTWAGLREAIQAANDCARRVA